MCLMVVLFALISMGALLSPARRCTPLPNRPAAATGALLGMLIMCGSSSPLTSKLTRLVSRAVEVAEAKECEVCEKVVEDVRKSVFKKLPSASLPPPSPSLRTPTHQPAVKLAARLRAALRLTAVAVLHRCCRGQEAAA